MKLIPMKQWRKALAALAAALFATQSAQALTTYNVGDLMLGFTKVGSANELVFDLGNITNLTDGTTWNLGTDLGNVLGSGWNNNADVQWGLVGANANEANGNIKSLGYTRNTLWITTAVGAPVPLVLSNSAQSTIRSIFQTMTSSGNWVGQVVNTAYSNGLSEPTSGSGSWTSLNNGVPGSSGPNFGLGYSVMTDFGDGVSGAVLDLYRLDNALPGNAILIGTLSIDDSGLAIFNAAAVPEPSTYALIGLAGVALLAARRRLLARA